MCVVEGADDILILYSFMASEAVCTRQDYVAIMHLTCPALCLREYLMWEAQRHREDSGGSPDSPLLFLQNERWHGWIYEALSIII